MDKLIAKARQMETTQVLEAVTILGGGRLSVEAAMVRAALIEVYGEREGFEAADLLMDQLGM